MTPVTSARGRHLALFGLGGSGLATARALLAGRAEVTVWDDSEAARNTARVAGLNVADLRDIDWSGIDSLVLSPGVPLTHPEPHWAAKLAKAAGVEIIGDIELFCRERAARAPEAPFVAITGTNGKSTTTALTAHLFRTAGWDVQMGGNIGTPALALEPPLRDRVHVLELSTFQIDLALSLNPTVGVLLNLTPDHIDRHGTMENYAAIKERLVASAGTAVIGIDDPYCQAIAKRLATAPNVVTISVAGEDAVIQLAEGTLWRQSHSARIADLNGMAALRGVHNAQNAAAAIAALQAFGPVRAEVIAAGLHSYPGLPHRMEQVGNRGRVLFINDSKATNADAAEQSLKSFDPIFWIVGGVTKEGGITPLQPWFPRIAKAYLIGKSSDAFAAQLEGKVPFDRCGTLEVAVASAARDAALSSAPEPAVLLAPACASYDQFRNFEQRGDRFRALVEALPDLAAAPARGDTP